RVGVVGPTRAADRPFLAGSPHLPEPGRGRDGGSAGTAPGMRTAIGQMWKRTRAPYIPPLVDAAPGSLYLAARRTPDIGMRSHVDGDGCSAANEARQPGSRSRRQRAGGNPGARVGVVGPKRARSRTTTGTVSQAWLATGRNRPIAGTGYAARGHFSRILGG